MHPGKLLLKAYNFYYEVQFVQLNLEIYRWFSVKSMIVKNRYKVTFSKKLLFYYLLTLHFYYKDGPKIQLSLWL